MSTRRIDKLFAFVVADDAGNEGVVGYMTELGWLPMIGSDMVRMDDLRPTAARAAEQLDRPVTLMRFMGREPMEVLHPDGETERRS